MNPRPITDHVARAKALLTEEYRGLPNIDAMLTVWAKQVQELEVAIWSVIYGRCLGEIQAIFPAELPVDDEPFDLTGAEDGVIDLDASGVALDILGQLVGADPRGSLSDAEYRVAVKTQVRVNRSKGTAEDILGIIALAVPLGSTSMYTEYYPAGFDVTVLGGAGPISLQRAIKRAKALTTHATFTYNATDLTTTLFWGSSTGPVTVPGSTTWGANWASSHEVSL